MQFEAVEADDQSPVGANKLNLVCENVTIQGHLSSQSSDKTHPDDEPSILSVCPFFEVEEEFETWNEFRRLNNQAKQ
jgi:hypothetical protein